MLLLLLLCSAAGRTFFRPTFALPFPLQAARADAVAHFKAMLQEMHLTADARWRDYADRIKRDPQVGSTACLPQRVRAHLLG